MCSETVFINDIFKSWNTDSKIDYDINNNLSIYIPHILEKYANLEYIKNCFHNLDIAQVIRVDFHNHQYLKNDKICFIHMKWYKNTVVENLQRKIMDNNEDAKLVYDDPKYWTLLQNKRPIENTFTEQFNNLQNSMFSYNKGISERMYHLEKKNYMLENTVKQMESQIILQHGNTLTTQETNTNIYTNNSCCGMVSDGWNPYGESSSC